MGRVGTQKSPEACAPLAHCPSLFPWVRRRFARTPAYTHAAPELLCWAWGSKAPSAVTGPSAPRIYELGARVRIVVASRRPGRARTRLEHELGLQGARPSFRAAAGINCGGGVYERGGGDLLKVLVTGRRGKMARGLVRMLVEGGHEVRGLVRKEERLPPAEADGAEPVLCALESETVEGGIGGQSRAAT